MSENEGRLVNTWESLIKNDKGEAEIHTLHKYDHTTEQDISELLVRPASPITIKPLRRTPVKKTKEITTLVGGDAQFPFGDSDATQRFIQTARDIQPEEVLLVGDMVDLPALSKYPQRKEWVGSTQAGIDEYYLFLAQLRANVPNAKIISINGNHEQRLINSLERNMNELSGLKVAMGQRALLSIQNLVRFDELGVESVDGYPSGTYWLEDNLKATHGTYTKTGGSNAARYLATEHESTIYGHTHRQELAYRTVARRVGSATIAAASPGALCLTDGSVPGVHYSPTADGEIVKKAENWQNGHLIVQRTGLKHKIGAELYE